MPNVGGSDQVCVCVWGGDCCTRTSRFACFLCHRPLSGDRCPLVSNDLSEGWVVLLAVVFRGGAVVVRVGDGEGQCGVEG